MDTIEIINIEQLKESYKLIIRALNSGCKAGVFTLDDSYLLKIETTNIEKTIKILETRQPTKSNNEISTINVEDNFKN